MTEDLFFNKLVTKSMEAVHGEERFFEGYLTVQIKDKQGEITVVDELYKVLPVWMDRGAPISDTHSNRIIGKGINYSKETYKDKDGEEYPAIKITGKIHKDYELDNEIWKKIKSGEYKGLSFGGATKSDRDPVRMKDGSIAYSLKDLEHYEVAVCADPAVPLALITDYNPVAKSATNAVVREDGKMVIKCDKFGCYVTKPIPDSKGGKGDFDHCEEKNQDKNDPAAFCGAIQHKLEKAIEAGMLQQVVKNGLEIFLTKEELNKVCSACGKTLEEHGVVKYDHSNSMGDQHSMYNQNSGRETWVGQGLPQPTVEGKDDNPAERGLTINGDAMQHSDKKKKGKKAKRIPYKGDPFDLEESKRRGAAQVAEIKELLGLKEDEAFDESVDGFSTTGKKVKVKKTLELIVSKDSMDGKGSDKPKPEPTQGEKVMDKRIADEHTGYDPERLGEFPEHQPFHDRKVEEWDERQRGMFDQGDYQSFESKDREHWADRGVESDEKPDYADWLYEKFPDKEGLKKPRKDPLRKSLESMFKDAMTGSQSARGLPKQKEDEDFDAIEGILAEADVAADNQRLNTGTPRASEMYKSLEEIVRGDAEANPDMSPNEWLQWYKKRPKKKAEESNFGAGQRGLGYGNEGYTNVQGSGQSHTITEIPPEMEVIVHDVKDIKESKKEGYTTEAGNSKRGDPSRATDDDDSLLSQTFAKKDYKNTYIPLL